MTKEQQKKLLMESLAQAAMQFIDAERAYDESDGDDAADHMLMEDKKWRARETMDKIYDQLIKL